VSSAHVVRMQSIRTSQRTSGRRLRSHRKRLLPFTLVAGLAIEVINAYAACKTVPFQLAMVALGGGAVFLPFAIGTLVAHSENLIEAERTAWRVAAFSLLFSLLWLFSLIHN
jgi:hypothetical protein